MSPLNFCTFVDFMKGILSSEISNEFAFIRKYFMVKKNLCFGRIHDYDWKFGSLKHWRFVTELNRNREFYRTHDVRPPFTYVDMIRQVKQEYHLKLYNSTSISILRRSWKLPTSNLPFMESMTGSLQPLATFAEI